MPRPPKRKPRDRTQTFQFTSNRIKGVPARDTEAEREEKERLIEAYLERKKNAED